MSVAAHIPVFYEDAVADWERSVAKHVRAGNIMRIYFWMLLGAVLIFLGYELIFGSLIPPLVAIGLISFHCIIFAWITYQYKHLGRSIKRGDLKDVTSDLSGALGEMINPLKKAMHLENEELSVLLNTRDYATSPSVQGYGGRPYLILPLGFLKVLSVEPVFAKTILAHELGHVRQRDIDIHFLSRIIFRMSMTTLVPLGLLAALFGIGSSVDAYFNSDSMREQANSSAMIGSLSGVNTFQWYLQDRQRADEEEDFAENMLFQTGLLIIAFCLLLRKIRKTQGRSEQLADQAAALFGDVYAVGEAMRKMHRGRAIDNFLLKPTVQWRSDQLWVFTSKYKLMRP